MLQISEPLSFGPAEILTQEELDATVAKSLNGTTGQDVSATSVVQKLRASHHAVARLVAENVPDATISRLTGYGVDRISVLKHNPAFKELVAFYVSEVSDQQVEVVERLRSLALDGIDVLQERLLDEPEKIKTEDITKLVNAALDRSGNGPTSTVKSVNFTAVGTIEEVRAKLGRGVTLRTSRDGGDPAGGQLDVGQSLPAPVWPSEGEGSAGEGTAVRADGDEGAGTGV